MLFYKYLKLNGIPSQPVSRYLSNISKTYRKIEFGPELLTTKYCTIWQNYPPWSSIIYSSSGRIGQGTNALEIASGYNEGRSCGYQILSEREFLRKFPYRFMSPFERLIHGYFTWRMYHRKGHTSLCHRVNYIVSCIPIHHFNYTIIYSQTCLVSSKYIISFT